MTTGGTIAKIFVSLALSCLPSCQGLDCEAGWFGSSCQLKCRCSAGKCHTDGSCEANTICEGGWFGPHCQYADLAFKRSSVAALTDGRDNTCIFTRSTVEVALEQPYPITWIRIRLRRSGFLKQLSIHFTQNSAFMVCNKMRNFSIDDRTLDVYCDMDKTIQVVNLTGEAVKYLCSLYVSGGRNVALRQATEQSSTYSETSPNTSNVQVNFTSDRAVDGSTSMEFYKGGSCSSTLLGEANISWSVTFPKPQVVNRYVLYNMLGQEHRLNHFLITSYSASGSTVFHHSDNTSATNVSVFTVNALGVTDFVSKVAIRTNNPARVLVLCEVQVYGDSGCQTGRFGLECELQCECDRGVPCYASTGHCPGGCSPGFDGLSCDKMCPVGSYGLGCGFFCNPYCGKSRLQDFRTCHHVNGTCLLGCSPGFSDPFCSTDISGQSTYNKVLGTSIPAIPLLLLMSCLLAVFMKRNLLKKAKPVVEKQITPPATPAPANPVQDSTSQDESHVSIHEEEIEEISEVNDDEEDEPEAGAPQENDPNPV